MRKGNVLFMTMFAFCAAGCSTPATVQTIAQIALEAAGVTRPTAEVPDAQKPPRNVPLRIHAGANLNADAGGRPLALVMRVYKLRQAASFSAAPYHTFLDPVREKEAFGTDLIEVREITLTPGQRFETLEKVSKEADYIGVVALFHTPAPQRWRMSFRADKAEKEGLTLGMHACAITVGSGNRSASLEIDLHFLSSARCGV